MEAIDCLIESKGIFIMTGRNSTNRCFILFLPETLLTSSKEHQTVTEKEHQPFVGDFLENLSYITHISLSCGLLLVAKV